MTSLFERHANCQPFKGPTFRITQPSWPALIVSRKVEFFYKEFGIDFQQNTNAVAFR
jgi:hypothetical protein